MLPGGDTLLKRVAMMLWAVILMSGWAGTGSLSAAGAPNSQWWKSRASLSEHAC